MRFLPKIRRSEEDVRVRNAGLTHCITSPLLLPITLVYFCGKHVVDKYCLLYVRPHTLKNSGAFANTLESFIVIALLLYQLHMTLFVLSRVDLGSEVVTASSLALLFIMAGLLILSFVFYMGILQRALCPYSDGWRLSASLEKMAEAGEKLRGSLVEGMGNGGVLRQVLRTIDRTVSQSPAVPTEAESKAVEAKAEVDKVLERARQELPPLGPPKSAGWRPAPYVGAVGDQPAPGAEGGWVRNR